MGPERGGSQRDALLPTECSVGGGRCARWGLWPSREGQKRLCWGVVLALGAGVSLCELFFC